MDKHSVSFVNKLGRFFFTGFIFFLLLYARHSHSDEINVGFEPFPPLINEDGSGLVIDMLNTLTASADINFNVHIVTYARAKKELEEQRFELIGLTPYQLETKEFYQYGSELNWHINTHVDFFAIDKKHFNIDLLGDGSIGTLVGNAGFFSEIINVPENKFVEVSSLKQLVKMLKLGRLKVILFERVSTTSTIKDLDIQNIYYKKMGVVPASIAVSNTVEGRKLKAKLNALLANINNDEFFSEFINYMSMDNSGEVSMD